MDFIWFYGMADEFESARKVRHAVFVAEQGYSLIGEFDETDKTSWHIVGFDNSKPVCTSRLFAEDESTYHIGRVAVLQEQRGKKLGLEMMERIIEKSAELKIKKLVLNAQADKYYFYERAGFILTGKKLLDEGQPHVEMELCIGELLLKK